MPGRSAAAIGAGPLGLTIRVAAPKELRRHKYPGRCGATAPPARRQTSRRPSRAGPAGRRRGASPELRLGRAPCRSRTSEPRRSRGRTGRCGASRRRGSVARTPRLRAAARPDEGPRAHDSRRPVPATGPAPGPAGSVRNPPAPPLAIGAGSASPEGPSPARFREAPDATYARGTASPPRARPAPLPAEGADTG